MTPDICIYHANCMDGFTAAWVVQKRFPGIRLVPAGYGDPSPPIDDIIDKNILIVDFSYPADVLEAMSAYAKFIVVLDHHKTAQAGLKEFVAETPLQWGDVPRHKITAIFDMDKSGGRLALEFCFPGEKKVPPIVSYTEDRDLWRWQLPESRAINAALGCFTQDLDQWDRLNEAVRLSIGRADKSIIVFEGKAILAQREKDIDAVIDTTWRWMMIGGHRVPVANAPFFLASDIGNKLSEGNAFAGTYFDDQGGARVFSLRSKPEGADVSAIAKAYGGGGHRNAAGFKMPKGWEGDQ